MEIELGMLEMQREIGKRIERNSTRNIELEENER